MEQIKRFRVLEIMGELFESYLMPILFPHKYHQHLRIGLNIEGYEQDKIIPLTFAQSITLSWFFSILRGFFKLVVLSYFVFEFVEFLEQGHPIVKNIIQGPGFRTYYVLIFTAALDMIFFPVSALILGEFWLWIIRFYGNLLKRDPEQLKESSEQIVSAAMSSHLFYLIPLIGEFFQSISFMYLLYSGLRFNLQVSRSLAWVILVSPFIMFLFLAMFMIVILLLLV